MDRLSVATHEHNLRLWIERIRECRASGKTVGNWCEENGFGIKTYYYWMRKIKHEAFEALPANRKSKVLSPTHQEALSFTEVNLPYEHVSDSGNTAIILHSEVGTLEIKNGACNMVIENTLRAIKNLC